ncbi:PAS domain S-box protein [Planctomycetota bacterium]
MTGTKILVAEDESITAKDIAETLKSQGYDVPAVAFSGEEAIQKAEALRPDLVLMDIVLKGEVDGIAAAEQIRDRFDIPVVYLTAYTDNEIVARARITEPFGYIIKPFEARELRTNIEMALYKHKMERTLRESEERYRTIFDGSRDAVFIAAEDARFVEVNEAAVALTGYSGEELKEMTIPDLHEEEDTHAYQQFFHRIMSGEQITSEAKILRKDGIKVDTEFSNRRIMMGDTAYMHTVARDITERKRAEEALRESEEKYRSLFEGSLHPITIYDRNANIVMLNKVGADNFKRSLNEIIGKPLGEFIPEIHDLTVKRLSQVLETGKALYVEDEITLPEGKRWFYSTLHPILNPQGAPSLIQVVSYDITERKKAEEEKDKLLKAIEITKEAISIQSSDLITIYANDSMGRLFGYKKEELIGKNVSILDVSPKTTIKRVTDSIKNKGYWEGEIRNKKKDGTEFITYAITSVIKDNGGKIINYISTQHDITEKKKAEEELKESEEKFRTLFENSPDFVGITDLDGTILDINKVPADYNKREDVIGTKMTDYLTPDQKKNFKSVVERVIKTGKTQSFENIILTPKGKTIHWYNRVSAVKDDKDIKLIINFTDITDRKLAEEALRESEERFRKIYEQSPLGIEIFNAEGFSLDANRASIDMFGIADAAALKGVNLFENPNVPEEVKEKLRLGEEVQYEAPFDFGKVREIDYYQTSKAGVIDLSVWITPLRMPGKETPSGYLYKALDITQRKQAEETVAKEHEKLMAVFAALPYFVYIKAADHSIRFANQTFRDVFGEPAGCRCYEFFRGRQEPCEYCPKDKVFETQQARHGEWTSKEGRIYMAHDVPLADPDGTPLVLEIGIDILGRSSRNRRELLRLM